MFAIKFVGASLIVISSSLYGFLLANAHLMRLKRLNELKKTIVLLNGELKYNNAPLKQAMINMTNKYNFVFNDIFLKIISDMEEDRTSSFSKICCNRLEEMDEKIFYLKSEDTKKFMEFTKTIENCDRESCNKAFEGYISELDMQINEMNTEKDDKVKLYKTFGIMVGLFVAIIII